MILEPKLIAQAWLDLHRKGIDAKERLLGEWVQEAITSAIYNDVDYAFEIIERIHELDVQRECIETFSAGPLEELLVHQGYAVIEKIETKAGNDKAFASVLGGVWQNAIQDEIWERVKKARSNEIWADARN